MSKVSKVIYVDCDGVILDWLDGFFRWANREYGIKRVDGGSHYDILEHMEFPDGVDPRTSAEWVEEFNESSEYSELKPHLDAVKYMNKLYEECGYVYHVITAVPHASADRRFANLQDIFDMRMFVDITYVPHTKDKQPILADIIQTERELNNDIVYWIEDNAMAAKMGMDLGFETFLMHAYHNGFVRPASMHETNCNRRVFCWKNVYDELSKHGNHLNYATIRV